MTIGNNFYYPAINAAFSKLLTITLGPNNVGYYTGSDTSQPLFWINSQDLRVEEFFQWSDQPRDLWGHF